MKKGMYTDGCPKLEDMFEASACRIAPEERMKADEETLWKLVKSCSGSPTTCSSFFLICFGWIIAYWLTIYESPEYTCPWTYIVLHNI